MQSEQQPVQANPAVIQKPVSTVQTQQKPIVKQVVQPVKPGQVAQPVSKKPKRWWIFLLVAIFIIGGGIWAYFQFLS